MKLSRGEWSLIFKIQNYSFESSLSFALDTFHVLAFRIQHRLVVILFSAVIIGGCDKYFRAGSDE